MSPEARDGEFVETTYREAIRTAIREALLRDDRVFLMGEDVGRYGGCYAVTKGLLAEFGPERIRDTPLSEGAFVGAGIGAALGGMRPIVEVMTVNFSLLALDQIVNNAATIRHMSGGQFAVPVVIRMATGAGRQLAAQHSHTLEGWYAHVPGLKVVAPATIEDARGMLSAALADPNPVIIFEHVMLYAVAGKLPAVPTQVSLTGAAVRREGRDITLITYSGSLPKTLAAADALASEGISAEVIDLRCLRPLDADPIIRSAAAPTCASHSRDLVPESSNPAGSRRWRNRQSSSQAPIQCQKSGLGKPRKRARRRRYRAERLCQSSQQRALLSGHLSGRPRCQG